MSSSPVVMANRRLSSDLSCYFLFAQFVNSRRKTATVFSSVTKGVPQGSILGLMTVLYGNDLNRKVPGRIVLNAHVRQYLLMFVRIPLTSDLRIDRPSVNKMIIVLSCISIPSETNKKRSVIFVGKLFDNQFLNHFLN